MDFLTIRVLIKLITMNKTQISKLVRTPLLQQLWVPKRVVLFICVMYVASRSGFIGKYTDNCIKFKPQNHRISSNGLYII